MALAEFTVAVLDTMQKDVVFLGCPSHRTGICCANRRKEGPRIPGYGSRNVEELIGKLALTMLSRLVGCGVESPVVGGPFAVALWVRWSVIRELPGYAFMYYLESFVEVPAYDATEYHTTTHVKMIVRW